jgi:hypothetical protein
MSDCCKLCEASPVVLRCGRCLLVKYCDDDCQRQDWRRHKPHCITKEEQARCKGLSEELYKACCRGDVRGTSLFLQCCSTLRKGSRFAPRSLLSSPRLVERLSRLN